MEVCLVILIILHILGDFYFQSDRVARCKVGEMSDKCGDCNYCKDSKWPNIGYLLIHTALYSIPFAVVAIIDIISECFDIEWWMWLIVVVINAIMHFGVDFVSCFFKKKNDGKPCKSLIFILDQLAHIACLIGCMHVIHHSDSFMPDTYFVTNSVYIIFVAAVLFLVKPCANLIDYVFEDTFGADAPAKKVAEPEAKEEADVQAEGAAPAAKKTKAPAKKAAAAPARLDVGRVIGVLERLIYIVLIMHGAYSAIAIVVAIKTMARITDLKEQSFRSKYIVGTLMSLCLALVTTFIL